jgi:hypothetical protein
MNKTSPNYTWRTCGNKEWLRNHIITIYLHGLFLKVNNNQLVDLSRNQIMRCIIYHNDIVPPKILAMHTRCKKGLIAYHKFNGITTMKKHVDFDHFILLKQFLEDVTSIISRSPFNHEPIKRKQTYVQLQYLFFYY